MCVVHSKEKMPKKFGTRQEVFDGTADSTRGGLVKDDLMLSKNGKIVSKKKSMKALENYKKFGFKKRVKEEAKPVEAKPEPKKRRTRRKKKSVE